MDIKEMERAEQAKEERLAQMTNGLLPEKVTVAPIVGTQSGKSAFAVPGEKRPAPKPSKAAPVKQKAPSAQPVKKETTIDYSAPLISVLQSYKLAESDFEKWIADKTKKRRGGYTSKQTMAILTFLAQFRYATASILSNIHDVTERATLAHMTRLISKGLVRRLTIPGCKSLFTLTANGMEMAGYDFGIIGENDVKQLKHDLGIACYASLAVKKGHAVVSERQIRSSIGRYDHAEKDPDKKKGKVGAPNYRLLANNAYTIWDRWDGTMENNPAFQPGGEWLFAMWDKDESSLANLFHIPDFVVLNTNGEGACAAYEIERSDKDVAAYTAIANNYRRNKQLFAGMVWYASTGKIKALITEGFTLAGIKPEEYKVKDMTVKNENGEPVRVRDGDFTKV